MISYVSSSCNTFCYANCRKFAMNIQINGRHHFPVTGAYIIGFPPEKSSPSWKTWNSSSCYTFISINFYHTLFLLMLNLMYDTKFWKETDSYADSGATIYRPQYHIAASTPSELSKKMATLLLCQSIQQSLAAVPHAKPRWSVLCQHLELCSCCGPVYCVQTAEMEG